MNPRLDHFLAGVFTVVWRGVGWLLAAVATWLFLVSIAGELELAGVFTAGVIATFSWGMLRRE